MKLRAMLDLIRPRRTSVADRSDYLGFCDRASRDPELFDRFKGEPAYNRILEHTTAEQGRAYFEIVRERAPHLLECADRFRVNDRHGGATAVDFGVAGPFAPSTLRYIKVLGDLESLFGDLGAMSIVEIGGGYGGQCVVIEAYGGFASYVLVDLAPCLRLARVYMQRCGVEGVESRTMDELDGGAAYDLVISNYAWSECTRPVQETYLQRVLLRAARRYLTCNQITPEKFESIARDELLERLPGARVLPEEPLTREGNHIVVWGDRRDGASAP